MLSRLAIPPVEGDPAAAVLDRLSQKTMPPGALGRLAALAPTLARAQRTEHPAARPAEALVFAADHGLHAEGTSPWPQAVTALMVETLCAGGAAAAVLAREAGARLTVGDVCVATAYRAAPPELVEARVRAGTRNA
ncbi:MAG: nicotinate-nucleotide--dimethylbenzimidazole phosphoribosyltransferase, partial [Paracoccaceae bacterium]